MNSPKVTLYFHFTQHVGTGAFSCGGSFVEFDQFSIWPHILEPLMISVRLWHTGGVEDTHLL